MTTSPIASLSMVNLDWRDTGSAKRYHPDLQVDDLAVRRRDT
jgi:hypothetical protein